MRLFCLGVVLLAIAACGDNLTPTYLAVTFESGPEDPTRATTAEFTFASPEAIAFTCSVDGAEPRDCASPHTVTTTDGRHVLAVVAIDSSDRAGPPATYPWRVDTVAPDTAITTSPPALTNDGAASFTLAGVPADDVARFECRVDGAPFAGCGSPVAVAVADGAHVFEARALDEAGNVDASAATFDWTVDTVGPMVRITSGPTGPVSSATVTYAFTAGADAVAIECAIDAGAFSACVSPFMSSSLGQGPHRFLVRAHDLAGNQVTASRDFEVDTLGPTVTITTGPSGPTGTATPTWTFTTGGDPSSIACRIDTGAAVPCATSFTAPTLGPGPHTFTVTAADLAANTASASRSIDVDTIAPTVTITGGPSGPTNVTAPTFTFTTGGSATVIECRVDSDPFAACTTATSHTTATLASGPHTFDVRVADAAGNPGSAGRSFAIDTDPPTVSITAGPAGPTPSTIVAFAFTTTGSPSTVECRFDTDPFTSCASGTVTATVTEGAHTFEVRVVDLATNASNATRSFTSDVTPPTVSITGGPTGPTATPTPTFTFTTGGAPVTVRCHVDAGALVDCAGAFTTATLGMGPHTFEVVATDAAGNPGSGTRAFSVDTTGPPLTITGAPADPTNDPTPTFTFTAPGAATVACQLDSGAPASCTSPIDLPALAEGSHTFTVSACNTASVCATDGRTFVVDVTPPTITLTGGPADPTPSNDATPTFDFTTGGSPATVACRIVDAVTPDPSFVPCSGSFTPAALADGAHTLEIRAIDAATNATTVTRAFTTDTDPPTVGITGGPSGPTDLTPPPVFTFTTAGGATSTVCAFDSDAPVSCTGSFTAPATLGEGPHTFTVTAVDAAANPASASRAFVVDTLAPTVSIAGPGLSPPTSNPSPSFTITTSVTGTLPIALRCRLDNAGAGFTPCTSPYAPGTLGDGPHLVEVEAEDPAGNVGVGSRAFTIDTQGPTVTIVAPLIAGITSNRRPAVAFTVSDASTFTIECAIDAGAFAACATGFASAIDLSEASHTYHVRATDAAGTPTTVDVTFVVDVTPPDASITMTPITPSADTTPTFAFTVGADAASVRCTLDSGQIVDPCLSPVTFDAPNGGPVAAGLRTFTLTVADGAVAPNPRNVTATFEIRVCGDGARTGTEQCDGSLLGGATCGTFPPLDGGALGCTASCTYDTSACTDCGNNVREGAEVCDGTDLAGASCGTVGFTTGILGCSATCARDTRQCFAPASTGFTGTVCLGEGLKFSTPGFSTDLGVCSAQGGLFRSAATPSPAWTSVNGVGAATTVINNLAGRGFWPQNDGPATWYLADASLANVGFRSNSWTNPPSTITWAQQPYASGGQRFEVFAARPSNSTFNIVGGWHPVLGASVLHGNFQAATIVASPVGAGITGTVRSIATGANGSTTDNLVAVDGFTPAGLAANGAGVYWSCDQIGAAGGTYVARDSGISATDKPLLYSLTVDPSSFTAASRTCPTNGLTVSGYANVYYAALRGGGQVYKTTDAGATWTPSNSGLPTGAEVYKISLDCHATSSTPTCPGCRCVNPNLLYAATSLGLYRSTNAGGAWTLAGFAGQSVRTVALEPEHPLTNPPRIFIAVDDPTDVADIYQANPP